MRVPFFPFFFFFFSVPVSLTRAPLRAHGCHVENNFCTRCFIQLAEMSCGISGCVRKVSFLLVLRGAFKRSVSHNNSLHVLCIPYYQMLAYATYEKVISCILCSPLALYIHPVEFVADSPAPTVLCVLNFLKVCQYFSSQTSMQI